MHWTWFLFSFTGRVNRLPFWLFQAALFALSLFAGMLDASVFDPEAVSSTKILLILFALWPSLAVAAKRWHDTGRPAWWILVNLVPFAGPLYALFVTGFMPGTPGENLYGPDPLEEMAGSAKER
jgi:uncharacterized membrane protein YhaH (DUF805 family)